MIGILNAIPVLKQSKKGIDSNVICFGLVPDTPDDKVVEIAEIQFVNIFQCIYIPSFKAAEKFRGQALVDPDRSFNGGFRNSRIFFTRRRSTLYFVQLPGNFRG